MYFRKKYVLETIIFVKFWLNEEIIWFQAADSSAYDLNSDMTSEPNLQTIYEYFGDNGNIQSGLAADERDWFVLNGKKFRIFSGSLHYFRIHPDHWRDRLRKYRAAGLNAIDV